MSKGFITWSQMYSSYQLPSRVHSIHSSHAFAYLLRSIFLSSFFIFSPHLFSSLSRLISFFGLYSWKCPYNECVLFLTFSQVANFSCQITSKVPFLKQRLAIRVFRGQMDLFPSSSSSSSSSSTSAFGRSHAHSAVASGCNKLNVIPMKTVRGAAVSISLCLSNRYLSLFCLSPSYLPHSLSSYFVYRKVLLLVHLLDKHLFFLLSNKSLTLLALIRSIQFISWSVLLCLMGICYVLPFFSVLMTIFCPQVLCLA